MEKNEKIFPLSDYSDEDLMELMSYKDEYPDESDKAFNEFYRRYSKLLWKACNKVCSSFPYAVKDELVDIVYQETMQSVYKYHSFTSKKGKIELWLFKIAHNALKSALNEISFKQVHIDDLSEISESEEETQDNIDTIEMKILNQAIHSLSEREQHILLTYYQYSDGKKHLPDEILNELSIKYNTTTINLRQIKKRALDKIHLYIEEHSKLKVVKS